MQCKSLYSNREKLLFKALSYIISSTKRSICYGNFPSLHCLLFLSNQINVLPINLAPLLAYNYFRKTKLFSQIPMRSFIDLAFFFFSKAVNSKSTHSSALSCFKEECHSHWCHSENTFLSIS